jgi:MFS family permease
MEASLNEVLAQLRDPMGVPLYPVVFQLLMVLTFAIHIVFVNFTLGCLTLSVGGWLAGGERWRRLSASTAKMAAISVSFAILIGVAPLLFVQVIYDPFWYASNVLSGAWVIGFVLIMMTAYALTYVFYLRRKGEGRGPAHALWGILGLAGFLLAGFVMHVLNYQALFPEQWLGWLADGDAVDTSGLGLHAFEWSRFSHFILASFAITGLLLMLYAWFFKDRKDMDADYLAWVAKLGARMAFWFTVVGVATGLWWAARIPADLNFHSDPFFLAGAALGVALLVYLWFAGKDPVRHAVPASGFAFLVVLIMSAARESLRMDYLAQHGYTIFDYKVNLDWGSTALFFGTFLWGFIAMGYLLAVAVKAGRSEGEVDGDAAGLTRFGNLALGSVLAWVVVMVVLGVYITLKNMA